MWSSTNTTLLPWQHGIEALPDANGHLPPPPNATPPALHEPPSPSPPAAAATPAAREGALSLQALQGRTGLLAALSLHADEERRHTARLQLDSAKARISTLDRRRTELLTKCVLAFSCTHHTAWHLHAFIYIHADADLAGWSFPCIAPACCPIQSMATLQSAWAYQQAQM